MIQIHIAALLSDRPSRCPCGAATEYAYGLCVKCQARAAWKRRKAPGRHAARRLGRRLGKLLPAPRTPRRPAIARAADRTR